MKQFIFIFILSFFLQISFGQVLTKDEAYAFADKLLEVKILSERGRNMLKMQIDLNQDGNQPMDIESPYVTGASFKKNISISYVLDFCFFAFQNEQAFRMGMEMIDVISKKYAEENGKQYLDEADLEAVNKIFNEQSQDFECLKIEDRIPNEEGYLEEEELVRSINFGRKIEKRLIHESRSVLGKTRSRTAKDLFEMGLISEKVFDAIIEKIKLKELNTELAVVGFAKYQIKIEENFPIEKAGELKILNNLRRVDLLSEVKYQELTELKNANRILGRFEIFSQCKNAKTLKILNEGEEPMVCFQKMLEEIKAVIPDFDYENFDYKIGRTSFGLDE